MVKYKKNGNVSIDMNMREYEDLLKGHNDLKSALEMMTDSHDIYLSDLKKLESLMHSLKISLGFVSGSDYYSDATLPTLNPR
jgi:hypothetical protein